VVLSEHRRLLSDDGLKTLKWKVLDLERLKAQLNMDAGRTHGRCDLALPRTRRCTSRRRSKEGTAKSQNDGSEQMNNR
jgi:hypothetical protein